MKQCLDCYSIYQSSFEKCSECGVSPSLLDGFPAYAPSLAYESSGFKSSYFEHLAQLEEKNFWFCARNRLIIWALSKYCSQFHSLLEIGCGTGYVLSGIAKAYPHAYLQGSEIFTKALPFAAARLPAANFMQMDARQLPFANEFDCIGAFDVLEHIEEDEQVLMQIQKALKPGGILLLTVPQHKWLWSSVDDYACHVRRYTAKEIQQKLSRAGYKILRSTSFVSSLLPAMFLSRIIQKSSDKAATPDAGLEISPWMNCIFEKMLDAEIAMIRKGVNFAFGGSRLVVASAIKS